MHYFIATLILFIGFCLGNISQILLSTDYHIQTGREQVLRAEVICVPNGVSEEKWTYECKSKEQFEKELKFLSKITPLKGEIK